MPVRAVLTTKGLSEYLEQVARLGADVDEVTDQALEAGGQVLLDGMLKRVPRLTGNLADNLSVDGPHQDGNYHFINVGLNHGVDGETARYGSVQEYGSAHTPAQPFIRPTIDEDLSKARKAMATIFKKVLGLG